MGQTRHLRKNLASPCSKIGYFVVGIHIPTEIVLGGLKFDKIYCFSQSFRGFDFWVRPNTK